VCYSLWYNAPMMLPATGRLTLFTRTYVLATSTRKTPKTNSDIHFIVKQVLCYNYAVYISVYQVHKKKYERLTEKSTHS